MRIWHRLQPWPDVVAGLTRLKSRYIIGTLSNGNVGLLTRLGKNVGLPWDVILGAETAEAYKPMPRAYQRACLLLNLAPAEVMLVAAHNGDLAAAAKRRYGDRLHPAPDRIRPASEEGFQGRKRVDALWPTISATSPRRWAAADRELSR